MAPIYERVQQVCDEEQSKRDLAAKDSSNSDSKQSNSTATHAYRSAVARAALVTGTVAVVALVLTTLCAGGFDRFVAPSSSNEGSRKLDLGERRRVKRAQVDAPTSSLPPKYSSLTTTGAQGEPTTQSFVYTTRPIVNPGGYTIGTLTGYVQITATPTNNATSSSASSSLLTEPTPAPTLTSTETAAQEEPANTDYSRVPWVSRDHEADEDAPTTADPAAPTAGTRLAKRAEVIDDESAPEPPVTEAPSPIATTPSATDGAEYSTSTDRAGSVYTLVKTTRPIVNPGGFTIGTLDGAWVDVAKQTQGPSAAAAAANRKKRAASSPIAVPNNPHDELRRRNVVDLAASA